ncbi:Cytochrome c oxidase, subunit VIb [Parasponia andersonii]|uniref:Cytochrome c oxidase, subunit VIb n=1 Tax=Parasponia andersonii TaxID=3476 RepID=A0A2P5C0P1_PARAD|nr:Cytochrome c oxidase, subunit VIb [Parasponia andersonii]
MSKEAYAPRNPNEIHTDVLSEARQACYKARDAFYACLEKESEKKPTEIASVGLLYPSECEASRAKFVKLCRGSWVNHFDRQYCRNRRVHRLLDDKDSRRGPLVLPQPYTFKPTTTSNTS